jgi:hypothetical protein
MGETLNSHQFCNIQALSQEDVNESNQDAFGTLDLALDNGNHRSTDELNCASRVVMNWPRQCFGPRAE